MEKTYTIYDLATGAIKYTVSIDDAYAADQGEYGDGILDGDYRNDQYYVDLGTYQPVAKAEIPYQQSVASVPGDGVSEMVISGLPNPTQARIWSNSETVTDGSLELTFNAPGEYQLKLDAGVAYLPETLTLVAT
jgi:hypothetical protein